MTKPHTLQSRTAHIPLPKSMFPTPIAPTNDPKSTPNHSTTIGLSIPTKNNPQNSLKTLQKPHLYPSSGICLKPFKIHICGTI
ncbi:hypothetical protein HRI_003450500 [Hibiscus trionum]|uniref:Uncharacterized protein n=1 Tax=Hibiscus trionum TaxID=183268 RepID=A0A9W7IJH3_HIBTR|nr:hypothetical protein HRI_003450500 [Hibiscus trionum]